MNNLVHAVSAMPQSAITDVIALEDEVLKLPQVDIKTQHSFHAGMYARTIMIPAGVILTGSLIKIATILVINGDAIVYTADGPVHISGYNVMLCSEGRKQAFLAHEDTFLTMIFPSSATTVEEAEFEFTDEAHRLSSRRDDATNIIVTEG